MIERLYPRALSARAHGQGGSWGVGWVFTEPVRASPPSLIIWPGVPHPRLAYSLVHRMRCTMRHKVPRDTDIPDYT